MIVEWYGLKILCLGLFLGYYLKKKLVEFNESKCYEIKSILKRREL